MNGVPPVPVARPSGDAIDDLANTWTPYLTMSEGMKLASQAFTRELARLSCCAA